MALESSSQTNVYIPPKWPDMAPLVVYSIAIWSLLLFLAAARVALHQFLTSKRLRDYIGKVTDPAASSSESHGVKVFLLSGITAAYKKVRTFLARYKIQDTHLVANIALPRFVAGALVCLFYCFDTYRRKVTGVFYLVQVAYGVLVLVLLIYDFVYTARPVLFLFQPHVIVECLTIPSLLFASNGLWLNFNFLQAYCVLMQWHTLEQHEVVLRNASSLTRLMANIYIEMTTFMFITACGVHFFELLGDPGSLGEETFQITWANSVYFAVVTIMTVGYGDFVPYTFFGRIWIVVHIVRAAYFVARETAQLFEKRKTKRRGAERYVKAVETHHVVVTGRVKWEFLRQFIQEFLKENNNADAKVVVLTSSPTWTDDDWNKFISRSVFYDYHVVYIEGTPLEFDDLQRARVESARAVFLLPDPHRSDPYMEDSDTLKAILSIRNSAGNVPIFTFNISHDSSFQFGIAMELLDEEIQPHLMPVPTLMSFPNTETPAFEAHDNSSKGGVRLSRHISPAGGAGPSALVHESEDNILASISHDLYSRGINEERGSQDRGNGGAPHITPGSGRFGPDMARQSAMRLSENCGGESLCMQELEMALLAENVFCNGLSTLIANLTLRFAPVPLPTDRTWLLEYKLGAQCCIFSFRIPSQFHNRRFRDVAAVLQDYGIVILAVFENDRSRWHIVTVDTVLEEDVPSMIITYHQPHLIPWIVENAVSKVHCETDNEQSDQRYTSDGSDARSKSTSSIYGLSRKASVQQISGALGVRRDPTAKYYDTTKDEDSDIAEAARFRAAVSVDFVGRDYERQALSSGFESSSTDGRGVKEARKTQSLVVDGKEAGRDGKQQVLAGVPLEDEDESSPSKPAQAVESDTRATPSQHKHPHPGIVSQPGRAPERLRGGADVTQPGSRRIENTRRRHRIYSNLHGIKSRLSQHVIVCLDGENPLTSLKVLLKRIWKKRTGQKRKTQVVVIHPNFPKNFDREIHAGEEELFLLRGHSLSIHSLEQAQYTRSRALLIMTSENRDPEFSQNTDSKAIFTVMTLDRLLNETRIFVCCMLDAEDSLRLMRAPKHRRQIAFGREDSGAPFFGSDRLAPTNRSLSVTLLARPYDSSYGSITRGTTSAIHRSSFTASKRSTTFLKGGGSTLLQDRSDITDEDEQALRTSDRDSDHSEKHRSGGELFERQRYASGEMIISSLFAALLVREEAQPGFSNVIRELLGLEVPTQGRDGTRDSRGSWVRLLQIPESWTSSGLTHCRNYRETSLRLQRLGCVAIGLYRSGQAPVRWAINCSAGIWERRMEKVYYTEETEKSALLFGRDTQGSLPIPIPLTYDPSGDARNMDDREDPGNVDSSPVDDFERGIYTCPTTERVIEYGEKCNDNFLPYVYCFPEPYTVVDSNDGIFVLCHPKLAIPANWSLPDQQPT